MASRQQQQEDSDDLKKKIDNSEQGERGSRQNDVAADPTPAETAAELKQQDIGSDGEAPHGAGDSRVEGSDTTKRLDGNAASHQGSEVHDTTTTATVNDGDKGSTTRPTVEQPQQHEREASHRTTQDQYAPPLRPTEAKDKLILEKFTLYKTESVSSLRVFGSFTWLLKLM